ncbi:MAG TPA: glycerol-3-phosphate 1-O-acyltransferase PlsY [Ruminiclostridium sp.]|nr:glycerol-3-phosphate 1-O-acyltransferase PlsY [Ruminiclostridium sp.]
MQTTTIIAYILAAVAAYLLGSISFSIIITKQFAGTDVRRHGSGNAGATNVLRTAGKLPAVLTFACDFLKVVAAMIIAIAISSVMNLNGELRECLKYTTGIFCMIGHIFPLYFGFKGGKGVTAAAAVMLLLDWRCFLIAITVFVILVAVTRYVSLGSVCAAASLPFITIALQLAGHQKYAVVNTLLVTCITAIIIAKHYRNIKRLLNGTEPKLHSKS